MYVIMVCYLVLYKSDYILISKIPKQSFTPKNLDPKL